MRKLGSQKKTQNKKLLFLHAVKCCFYVSLHKTPLGCYSAQRGAIRIFFDKHLTFKHHVDVIAQKISKSVSILFKLSEYLPLEIIKTLYYSLINPFLIYGIEVCHGTYAANITNKIFILQKKACRTIHNLPFNTHTTEYFKNAKILILTDLYES